MKTVRLHLFKLNCLFVSITLCLSSLIIMLGCSDGTFIGLLKENKAPTIRLTSGPMEGDTINYNIRLYWLGYDEDGTISHYEFVLTEGDPVGFDPDDTTGLDKWTKTIKNDSIFTVTADNYDSTVTINNNPYGLYTRMHTFFIKAVDDRGMRSEAAHCSFTATTLAPYSIIFFPVNPHPGLAQYVNPIVTFKWIGRDPIDTPWNYQDVDSIRYLLTVNDGYTVYNLNKHPEMFEELWSPWIWYHSPSDSGWKTTLGDDEILEINKTYAFVIQAKDEAGAITSVFNTRTNVRQFMPLKNSGPLLNAWSPYLGYYSFIGDTMSPKMINIISGFPVEFSWIGDASHYGGIVSTYRYGWDIEDLNNPEDWDVHANPFHVSSPEKRLYFGTHVFYIEAVDNFGTVTLGQFEINILPMAMTRDLLWIDDFPSGEFYPQVYALPQESEHDEFWINICQRAPGFNPEEDIYDTIEHNLVPPSIELIFKYKSIIWTYSTEERSSVWDDIVHFRSGGSSAQPEDIYNYVASYLKAGGHLWTLGKSDRAGGLTGALPLNARQFPMNVMCEIRGNTSGCTDTSGVECMAYRDYCVTMLDKVNAGFRFNDGMPKRDVDRDALYYGYKDDLDEITAAHPDLPDEIHLWEKVTQTGKYFDPKVRGFLYVEAYDPEYWMSKNSVYPQPCMHPMYRMKARNTRSCLEGVIIAFWVTKYADVKAEAPGTVPALSVHFGFPLWFFDRNQANAVADAIFTEWQIK